MKRTALILEVGLVLLLCAGGAALSHLWKKGPLSIEIAGVALLIPCVSTILFLCISMAVPELYAVGRLRFPLTLTLPVVYSAILATSTALLTRVGLSITKVPDRFEAINLWSNPWLLLWTTLAGVLCLSALGALAKERTSQ